MKNNIKNVVLALAMVFMGVSAFAKPENAKVQATPDGITAATKAAQGEVNHEYACAGHMMKQDNPLTPCSYAMDPKTQTIVIIDNPENAIAVLKRNDKSFDVVKKYEVDVVVGRHDVDMIYRPVSVSFYGENIVYLASNRDSSYVGVLNLKGEHVASTRHFAGATTAFAIEHGHMTVVGSTTGGFTAYDIDVRNGIENIAVDTVSTEKSAFLNYGIPKKADEMAKHDPHGLALTVIAMSTVFLALIVISIVIMGFGRSLQSMQRKKQEKLEGKKEETDNKSSKNNYISGDEFASIAAAIYMYNEELHDEESTIITITEVNRRYSPWSSKIHNMNVYKK